MPTELQIAEHRKAQQAAKLAMVYLTGAISADDTEQSIARKAHEFLCDAGYQETWYYQCPALVLLGSRSCVSISGRDYQASTETVGSSNLITIDLSPARSEYWGDYARSLVVEDGKVIEQPKQLEFKNGLHFLQQLHQQMLRLVKPSTTFDQLFEWANVRIRESGFVNLDYRGNVGHSIAASRDHRQFIEARNCARLGDVPFFSFEPFVRLKGGRWGFKHEDIFFFNQDGQLQSL
ncbi:aminopeptidase P family protein [Undibacterium sp. Jales W-56]|uniref:M24 family metallopeptidase n=1 Tax=Undibacterium sp. Jales W-56 TaxID=2897325 RepID=UPI0021CF2871|nr:aminopeptidase P family protein [Undibacterium sp. Jales W-56]MCU6433506.1 aminopeptidase P family protein [Undibacterium sp. Jales W-56]